MNANAVKTFLFNKNKLFVLLFFLAYFILGTAIFRDYGVSWDELTQRKYGTVIYRSVIHGTRELDNEYHRYYGPVFEFFNIVLEKLSGLTDPRQILFLRHFANFCTFYLGICFFYLILQRLFRNRLLSITGCLFLILSPRLFASAFYNSKDIPFLALFIISMYTMLVFSQKPSLWNGFFHGLATGILTDIRVLGIIIVPLTLIMNIRYFYHNLTLNPPAKDQKTIVKKLAIFYIKHFLAFFGFYCAFTYLFWPTLWSNPIQQFTNAIQQMNHYPWGGTVMYFEKLISAQKLPWHYIPVWIGITTPLAYIVLFFIGSFKLVSYTKSFFRHQNQSNAIKNKHEVGVLFAFLWIGIPMGIVFISNPTLYDAWRHCFFIYPGLLIFCIIGLIELKRLTNTSKIKFIWPLFIAIIIMNLTSTIFFMVKYHPFQNVYFNQLIGSWKTIRHRFELDYWHLSYRKGLEYILKNDKHAKITILPNNAVGFILPKDQRKRLNFIELPKKFLQAPYEMLKFKEPAYLLTTYRWHPDDYNMKKVYSIKVKEAEILGVYKFKEIENERDRMDNNML
ncbi:hypothetical protein ACFLZV_02300 [Candidatus Margulisiibacteriota bacterium]